MKKTIFLFILFLLIFTRTTYGQQEVLAVDNAGSYVLDLDEGGKKYQLDNFLKSDILSLLEGHKLEAHIIINRIASAKPPDTYVLEMRTDLLNAEWQYKIFGETRVYPAVKTTVWNNTRDHSAFSFDIVLTGMVPKPAIKIAEPHFESYTGEGPGFKNTRLAVFTIYNGEVNPVNKVQEVGEYAFLSTNLDIKRYLDEIKNNLDTSGLNKESADSLEEHKENILSIAENGHVGLALDLSRSFADAAGKIKSIPQPQNNSILLIAVIIGGILAAAVTGFAGYKMGQGDQNIPNDLLDQFNSSYDNLKLNIDKLERINISGLPGATDQAVQLEGIKRQITVGLARLKSLFNQLQSR